MWLIIIILLLRLNIKQISFVIDEITGKNLVKIAVPFKSLSNFWKSLEMPLINCKVEPWLKSIGKCMLTSGTTASFKITDAKLYVPIVALSSEDNVKLSKLLCKGFKRPIY